MVKWKQVGFKASKEYWKTPASNSSYNPLYSLYNPLFYKALEKHYPVEYWVSELGCMPLVENDEMYYFLPDFLAHVEVDAPVTNLRDAIISFPGSISATGITHRRRNEFMNEEVGQLELIYLELPSTWEEYLSMLKKNYRNDINKIYRKAGHIHFCRGVTEQNLKLAEKWFLDRWKDYEDEEDTDPLYKEFYLHTIRLINIMYETKLGDFWSLYVDGEFCGVNAGEIHNGEYLDFYSSRHPEFDREYSLGKLITCEMIKRAIASGFRYFNLSVTFPYKLAWLPKDCQVTLVPNIVCIKGEEEYAEEDMDRPYYLNNMLIV